MSSERLRLEGSLERAYVCALRVRLAQAKQYDKRGLLSPSCPVCKEVVRIKEKKKLIVVGFKCDICPIHITCREFVVRREQDEWVGLVAWLSGLLEEASK